VELFVAEALGNVLIWLMLTLVMIWLCQGQGKSTSTPHWLIQQMSSPLVFSQSMLFFYGTYLKSIAAKWSPIQSKHLFINNAVFYLFLSEVQSSHFCLRKMNGMSKDNIPQQLSLMKMSNGLNRVMNIFFPLPCKKFLSDGPNYLTQDILGT